MFAYFTRTHNLAVSSAVLRPSDHFISFHVSTCGNAKLVSPADQVPRQSCANRLGHMRISMTSNNGAGKCTVCTAHSFVSMDRSPHI